MLAAAAGLIAVPLTALPAPDDRLGSASPTATVPAALGRRIQLQKMDYLPNLSGKGAPLFEFPLFPDLEIGLQGNNDAGEGHDDDSEGEEIQGEEVRDLGDWSYWRILQKEVNFAEEQPKRQLKMAEQSKQIRKENKKPMKQFKWRESEWPKWYLLRIEKMQLEYTGDKDKIAKLWRSLASAVGQKRRKVPNCLPTGSPELSAFLSNRVEQWVVVETFLDGLENTILTPKERSIVNGQLVKFFKDKCDDGPLLEGESLAEHLQKVRDWLKKWLKRKTKKAQKEKRSEHKQYNINQMDH